jgi:DNA gyrase subunit A
LVVKACQITDEDEIMLITDGGKIIRMNMAQMRVIGRNTKGVRMFKLGDDEKVVAMDKVPPDSGSDDEDIEGMEGDVVDVVDAVEGGGDE